MIASLVTGYHSHRIAAVRLNVAAPERRTVLSSNCWIPIRQQASERSSHNANICFETKLQQLRHLLFQFQTPCYMRHKRSSIVHKYIGVTPLKVLIWLPFHHSTGICFQIRHYLSNRTKLALKRGKKIMKRLPPDQCKIEFCHTPYDLRDYDERSQGYPDSDEDMDNRYHKGIFTVTFDSSTITKTAMEYYRGKSHLVRQQLEYYTNDTKRWKKFPFRNVNDDPDILYYRGKGSRPIPIRIISEYQEYDSSDDEDDGRLKKNEKVVAIGEEKERVMEMLTTLTIISQRFDRFEFRRSEDNKYMMSSKFINMGAPIPIAEWLNDQMTFDDELATIVLRQPGALKHIATCFAEFDELWNHEKDPFVDSDDETEADLVKRKPEKRIKQKKKKRKDRKKQAGRKTENFTSEYYFT